MRPSTGRDRRHADTAFVALAIALAVGWTALRLHRAYAGGVGDIYPLYWGARAWLHCGDAYNLGCVVPAAHHGLQLFHVGNVYPLPATLLALPLAVLPPTAASALFIVLSVGGLALAMRAARTSPLLLLFLPVLEAVRIEQPTALVLAAQFGALWALRTRRTTALGLLLAACLLKPSQTLVFVLVVLWMDRSHWRRHVLVVLAPYVVSVALQPDWPAHWVAAVLHRDSALSTGVMWLPWLALAAVPLLRWRDAWGAVAAAQLLVEPVPSSGLYEFAPMALGRMRDRDAVLLGVTALAAPLVAAFLPLYVAVAVLVFARVLVAWRNRRDVAVEARSPLPLGRRGGAVDVPYPRDVGFDDRQPAAPSGG